MFFSNKSKQQLAELQSQLDAALSARDQLLDENQSLKQRLLESEQQCSQSDNTEKQISECWLAGQKLVLDTRESVAVNAEALNPENQQLGKTADLFAASEGALATILAQIVDIKENSVTGNNQVQSLLEVSSEIEKFVSVIRDISDQTNLLALNAAIEAARAGESGRGFAVVADEVRNLARKANEASNEIANLVGQIGQRTQTACDLIGQVENISTEVVGSAETIKNDVSEVITISKEMKKTINSSAGGAFLETVKLDHITWKYAVYSAIVNNNFDANQSLADHTSCRMGKWYYQGDGRANYSHFQSFKALEEPHTRVHQAGLAALEQARAGNQPQMIKELKAMESASNKVADCLNQLYRESIDTTS